MIKCLILEGECEKNKVSKDVELTLQKNGSEQEQNKNVEKGIKRNGESKEK